MTSRERVLRALNHKNADRIPIHDSPWGATVNRWHREGLPEDMSPAEYFGYEIVSYGADLTPRFPVKVIERTEEYIITTTQQGGKRKNHRDCTTTPEVIDCPIKTKDDWTEIKKRLKPEFTRVDWASGLSRNQREYDEGKFTCFSSACGYDALQAYMNSEQLLVTIAEDPVWVKDMVMTLAENIIVMAELMLMNGYKFDGAWLFNDLGYKNGLLFSPDAYQKTHYEADRMLYAYFHSRGMKTLLHSCGNASAIIPTLIEVGLDCLQPLEVKAGMDLVDLKAKHGDRIAFMGGIDVRLMAEEDPSKIEEEIKKKIEAAKKNGGYIYHSDHSVPNNVSFQQYCRVMELVKKYGEYPEPVPAEPEAALPAIPAQTEQQKPSQPPAEAAKKKGFKLPFGKK